MEVSKGTGEKQRSSVWRGGVKNLAKTEEIK